MRSARPSWRVVTGNGKPGEWTASVECPEDWELNENTRGIHSTTFTNITVRRKPLGGPMGWWQRFVLHQTPGRDTAVSIFIITAPQFALPKLAPTPPVTYADKVREANTKLDTYDKMYKSTVKTMAYKNAVFRRVSHPLGPALMASVDKMTPTQMGTALTVTNVYSHYDSLCIVPTEAGDFSGSVTVTLLTSPAEANALKPMLDRMTRSLRLVKK